MAIPLFEEDMEIISKLGTRPKEENGVSESQLKALFDRSGVLIKKFLNEVLIPQMNMTIDVQAVIDGILDPSLTAANKAAPASVTGVKIKEAKDLAAAALSRDGGVMTGPVNMSHQQISNVPNPKTEYDAANKKYVDTRKTVVTAVLAPADWVEKMQTVKISTVDESSVIFTDFSAESVDLGLASDIRCTGNGKGELYFSCRWIPKNNVVVNIVVWN